MKSQALQQRRRKHFNTRNIATGRGYLRDPTPATSHHTRLQSHSENTCSFEKLEHGFGERRGPEEDGGGAEEGEREGGEAGEGVEGEDAKAKELRGKRARSVTSAFLNCELRF